MARKLKLWNGRWKVRQHIYVAAYSQQDVKALLAELEGYEQRGLDGEIRHYWSPGCWGRVMDGITPERGAWVWDERARTLTRLTKESLQQHTE